MNEEKNPVEEIRATRHRIAEDCGNDLHKIMEHAAETMRKMGLVESPSFALQ